jgi:phage host-nuclease inhibitor protein Gam
MSVETIPAGAAVSALTVRMRQLACKELELSRLRTELDSRLEAVKGVYERRITALEGAAGRMRGGIERFCRAQRDALMPDGVKSVRTLYGRAGFRRGAPQVVLDDGLDDEKVCRALQEREMDGLVRVRALLDRAAVKRALEAGEADEELLAACGIRLGGGDEAFYCVVEQASEGGAQG